MKNLLLAAMLFCTNIAIAQGTIEDYRRAYSAGEKFSANKVFYSNVNPEWIGKTHYFWYVRNTPDGRIYVLVDADTQNRKDLFDHKLVAAALSEASGRKIEATSLYLESGREFDRSQIPGLVMEAFENYYEKFAATCNLSGLKAEYESILANYNQPVRVLAKEPYEGIARGITDSGELLVEKTDGTVVEVSAGEVSVRGLYSYV